MAHPIAVSTERNRASNKDRRRSDPMDGDSECGNRALVAPEFPWERRGSLSVDGRSAKGTLHVCAEFLRTPTPGRNDALPILPASPPCNIVSIRFAAWPYACGSVLGHESVFPGRNATCCGSFGRRPRRDFSERTQVSASSEVATNPEWPALRIFCARHGPAFRSLYTLSSKRRTTESQPPVADSTTEERRETRHAEADQRPPP